MKSLLLSYKIFLICLIPRAKNIKKHEKQQEKDKNHNKIITHTPDIIKYNAFYVTVQFVKIYTLEKHKLINRNPN